MSKTTERVLIAMLVIGTAASVVTAAALVKIAFEGFEVVMSDDEALELVMAAEAATSDIRKEE